MDSARQVFSACPGTMDFFSTSSPADMDKRDLLAFLISQGLMSSSGIVFLTIYET